MDREAIERKPTNGHPPADEEREAAEAELVELAEAGPALEPILPAVERPSGPAAAVLLATGIASAVLGLLTMFSVASPRASSLLTFSDRVGDLSGISIITFAVFFGSWALLTVAWRKSNPSLVAVGVATAVLVALCFVATFPPVFHVFDPPS
jgi:hypothetical protein